MSIGDDKIGISDGGSNITINISSKPTMNMCDSIQRVVYHVKLQDKIMESKIRFINDFYNIL